MDNADRAAVNEYDRQIGEAIVAFQTAGAVVTMLCDPDAAFSATLDGLTIYATVDDWRETLADLIWLADEPRLDTEIA